jgi:hypothetical protein
VLVVVAKREGGLAPEKQPGAVAPVVLNELTEKLLANFRGRHACSSLDNYVQRFPSTLQVLSQIKVICW